MLSSSFGHLPTENIFDILHKLPVADVVSYCESYNLVDSICNNEYFWTEYIRVNRTDKLRDYINEYNIDNIFEHVANEYMTNEMMDRMKQVIPNANSYILMSLFLQRSRVITYVKKKAMGIPYFYRKFLISGYTMLHDSCYEIPQSELSWLQLGEYTLLYNSNAGMVLIDPKGKRDSVTLLNNYDNAIIDDVYLRGTPILDFITLQCDINYSDVRLPD
jgi:hypothetical protein